jgi:hypothetical protein
MLPCEFACTESNIHSQLFLLLLAKWLDSPALQHLGECLKTQKDTCLRNTRRGCKMSQQNGVLIYI